MLVLMLFVAACGGGDDDDDDAGGGDADTEEEGEAEEPEVTGTGDEGTPVPGGEIVYGIEAETAAGWCLPEAQLAISGIQVARTIYDTLTMPDENGEIKPYLAESVTGNETNDVWTIKLREGITFHDGTPLDATVVKNNLDAYRGAYPNRSPLLFIFTFADVASVDVVDPLTVTVTTKRPWVSFPWFLWGSSRVGMMAPGAARLRELQRRPDRYRSVHAGQLDRQRRIRRGEEPELLGHRRRRQPAPVPRPDHLQAAHRRPRSPELARRWRVRRDPHLGVAPDQRDPGAG